MATDHSILGILALVRLTLGGIALLPCGCAFDDHRERLEGMHASGQYELAAQTLDDPSVHRLYGSKGELLWKMDRGAVALALDDDQTTIALLNQAEDTVALSRERSTADVVGQWTLNDRTAKYVPEPYEDIYINVLKMLAQFEAGRVDGGASVEARRLITKVDLLRDRYVTYQRTGSPPSPTSQNDATPEAPPPPSTENTDGAFIESPLGTFLSAVAFMKSGSREFQRVAGKRLDDAIRLQQGLIGPVRAEDFDGLGERDPDSVNLMVVALSGRGPIKVAERFGPLLIGTVPIYYELPDLRAFPSQVVTSFVEVEGQPEVALPLVEDLASVATENHQRMLPLIRARTIARTTAKIGLSVAATEAARRAAADSNQAIVQIGAALAGLFYITATERADIRCWMFLPGQAHAGLMNLEAGDHSVRVVYRGAGGETIWTSDWQTVRAREGGLATVVTHYWN